MAPPTYVTRGTAHLVAESDLPFLELRVRIKPTDKCYIERAGAKWTVLFPKDLGEGPKPTTHPIGALLANPNYEFKLAEGLGNLLASPAARQTLVEFGLSTDATTIISVTLPAPD